MLGIADEDNGEAYRQKPMTMPIMPSQPAMRRVRRRSVTATRRHNHPKNQTHEDAAPGKSRRTPFQKKLSWPSSGFCLSGAFNGFSMTTGSCRSGPILATLLTLSETGTASKKSS